MKNNIKIDIYCHTPKHTHSHTHTHMYTECENIDLCVIMDVLQVAWINTYFIKGCGTNRCAFQKSVPGTVIKNENVSRSLVTHWLAKEDMTRGMKQT